MIPSRVDAVAMRLATTSVRRLREATRFDVWRATGIARVATNLSLAMACLHLTRFDGFHYVLLGCVLFGWALGVAGSGWHALADVERTAAPGSAGDRSAAYAAAMGSRGRDPDRRRRDALVALCFLSVGTGVGLAVGSGLYLWLAAYGAARFVRCYVGSVRLPPPVSPGTA